MTPTERIAAALFDVAAGARDYRLPELYCGFDREGSSFPVAYPVACIPQAWAAATPFMLLQAMLGDLRPGAGGDAEDQPADAAGLVVAARATRPAHRWVPGQPRVRARRRDHRRLAARAAAARSGQHRPRADLAWRQANRPGRFERRFEAVDLRLGRHRGARSRADASELRCLVEALCAEGMEIAVVSGTHVDNVDGQLGARPAGPGRCTFCSTGLGGLPGRTGGPGAAAIGGSASREEEARLDRAAELTVEDFARAGLEAKVVSQRLNRRKLDLIPEPEWADPPKARIAELVEAVEERLRRQRNRRPARRRSSSRSGAAERAGIGGGARDAATPSTSRSG